ncbi:hypothetical protein [Xenorhabdus szentirmaii]|uniref:Uncharacterized protein n=2 Tax=Xenorhabdus szentirmaii TaxID=290112 RepID=W1IV73_9GAMM|nr:MULTISPECIES: hypothetical protein [Xenorhabdus]MBD2798937.1 hypothetical protein [Xenorhabdus sp. M]PHM30326.1 hypothetical protein Xsze_04336 [Xenorhabdus szentirmaii DSM 16338]PHM44392.1 hypothetical protein Xszus_04224 [Xenorhabdus szentirmaii]CDL81115.1 conserved hypothetical protein [Xenorhabdus szentirmaii DSM 16338]
MKERKIEIKVIMNGKEENAKLSLISTEKRECFIRIWITDIYRGEFSGLDFFACFARLREELKDVIFLCKGAKINVYPSSMSRQMALGMAAYEHILGKEATREDLVGTFDFEDNDVAVSPSQQREYFYQWAESLKQIR